jgi:hypothetical protein
VEGVAPKPVAKAQRQATIKVSISSSLINDLPFDPELVAKIRCAGFAKISGK